LRKTGYKPVSGAAEYGKERPRIKGRHGKTRGRWEGETTKNFKAADGTEEVAPCRPIKQGTEP